MLIKNNVFDKIIDLLSNRYEMERENAKNDGPLLVWRNSVVKE